MTIRFPGVHLDSRVPDRASTLDVQPAFQSANGRDRDERPRSIRSMAKRSYGSGRLYEVERNRGTVYYGSWWSGGRRVKRRIGAKRSPGQSNGLTQVQAERELRRMIEREVVRPSGERRTFEQAADAYVDHLEHVMERKRSTIQDYRGYLNRHLVPFFGDRAIDRVDAVRVAQYLRRKRDNGLSSKTVQNHLNFLHGVFAFAVKRGWAPLNPVAHVDRPKRNRSPHTRVRFLQPHELDAVIRAVPDDTLGSVERPLYLTAALTGARQGELLALRWTDVDWLAQRLRIAENYTRGRWDTTQIPWRGHDRSRLLLTASRASSICSPETLRYRVGQRPRLLPPADRERPRPLEDPQALRRGDRTRPRARDHLPRAAPHLRHPDGGRRGAAARDPGMDGPRRRQDN